MSRRRLLWLALLLVPALLIWRLSQLDLDWLDGWLASPDGAQQAAPAEPTPVNPPAPPPVIDALSSRGVPFRLQRVPALRTPEPPYGPAYAALLADAEAGEPQAQYLLGLLLLECRDLPESTEALEAQVESVLQTHQRGQWAVEDPQTEAAELRRRHGLCAGVPDAARQGYRDWIRRAADAGLVEAMLKMQYALPQAEYCQYLWQCSPKQREFQAGLQQEALRYAERAREQGSADVLWSFGAWYLNDEVLRPDDVEAYAHFLALSEVHAAAGREARFGAMLAGLEERLRPVDLERARERADALLANPACCSIAD